MFSEIFVQLLQENKVSAYKLSKDTGISQALISQWKSNKQTPSYENLLKLADYFNISSDFLLNRNNLYDNPILIDIPKLQKISIQEFAKNQGKSLNAYIIELINEDMENKQSAISV